MALEATGIAGTGVSIGQIAGQVAGLDKAASSVAGAFSPTGKLVDTVGSALNLPDPLKNILKIALGAGTGDFMGIISGAFGLAANLMEELAKTQYQPSDDPVKAGCGYAPPGESRGSPTLPGQCAPKPGPAPAPSPAPCPPPGQPCVDPELLREKKMLEILTRDFGAIDNAGGLWFPDGRFSGLDMDAVLRGHFPPELKDAVKCLKQHPDKLTRLDISDGFDGVVSRDALMQQLCKVNAKIAQQGGHPAGPGVSGAGGPSHAPLPPSPWPGPGGPSREDQLMNKLGGAQREVDALMDQAIANPDDKALQLKLQKAQARMQELFTLLSNMFRSQHELRMTAIQNTK